MKYLISILFFVFSVNVFAANTVEDLSLEVNLVKDLVIDTEAKVMERPNAKEDTTLAVKYYYTLEWLYKECPFIERIEALA